MAAENSKPMSQKPSENVKHSNLGALATDVKNIQARHQRGALTDKEAAQQIDKLRRRSSSLWGLLLFD
jgi:hypothetical protein